MTFRALREKAGFRNGAQLAKLTGLNQTTISLLDSGKVADPRWSTLEALAQVLGTTPAIVMRAIRQTTKEAA